jgi:hypothetical protein
MNTYRRAKIYLSDGRALTPRQRRRLVKKAGADPTATVIRDDGMGYPPAMQGRRDLLGFETDEAARPVSGTGRGYEAVMP